MKSLQFPPLLTKPWVISSKDEQLEKNQQPNEKHWLPVYTYSRQTANPSRPHYTRSEHDCGKGCIDFNGPTLLDKQSCRICSLLFFFIRSHRACSEPRADNMVYSQCSRSLRLSGSICGAGHVCVCLWTDKAAGLISGPSGVPLYTSSFSCSLLVFLLSCPPLFDSCLTLYVALNSSSPPLPPFPLPPIAAEDQTGNWSSSPIAENSPFVLFERRCH